MLNAFRSSGRSKGTSFLVWALLGLLIIGLTGFGLGGAVSGLSSQNVARVGGEPVSREAYVRALFNQLDRLGQSTGQRLTIQQARLFGLDQEVLGQMITRAALDKTVADVNLSVSDALVADQLRQAPAFQGLNGQFDVAGYQFFLDRNGQSAGEYEEQLRRDLARTLLEAAIAGGVEMPPILAETLLAHAAETRGFSYVRLREDDLEAPLPAPTEAELQAYYDANADLYMAPETRSIRYAALRPADLAATIEISDADLEAEFASRQASLNQPERRIVDVIAFGSETEAQEQADAIAAGTADFSALAASRGLTDADLSLGAIVATDLSGAARAAVFGAEGPGVIGPVASDLGPALYRINAIVAARTVTLESIADDLREELALAEAQDALIDLIEPVQDLVAAGATVEEIIAETDMLGGTLELTPQMGDGLAGDLAFRRDAFEAEVGEERDLVELTNGGIAVIRVENITDPALRPFDEVRDAVADDWRTDALTAALMARAEALSGQLSEGALLAPLAEGLSLPVTDIAPQERTAQLDADLPPDVMTEVFTLAPGGTTVVEDLNSVLLIQLTEVVPVDPADPETAERLAQINEVLSGQMAGNLYNGYAQLLVTEAGVTVNQELINNTLAQYP